MDINQQTNNPPLQPPKPIEWTWIAQRKETGAETPSVWKFGFIAPDGASVRVTFHQIGNPQAEAAAETPDQMGMPPMPDPADFAPEGHPITDKTHDSTFYVTFFSNRHPDFFMKWDTSLNHEDSLSVWITITHGIIDFVRKAQPANIILDDLANGKLKMVLRSVAMDVAGANPEYELEQTQRHHYRSLFQIKRKDYGSAFQNEVQGKSSEGDTQIPQPTSPITGPPPKEKEEEGQGDGQNNLPQQNSGATAHGATSGGSVSSVDGDKEQDETKPQPEPEDQPGFATAQPVPIKQTPLRRKNLTVEIGKDYSVAVRDKSGNVIDRYQAKSPGDILRWINSKGFGSSRMVIVDTEQQSIKRSPEKGSPNAGAPQVEQYQVTGNVVRLNSIIPAKQAALMNYIINAQAVRCTQESVDFEFETDKEMSFKKALVELAFQKTNITKG